MFSRLLLRWVVSARRGIVLLASFILCFFRHGFIVQSSQKGVSIDAFQLPNQTPGNFILCFGKCGKTSKITITFICFFTFVILPSHQRPVWKCGRWPFSLNISPPARWGLLDFMSVASCLPLLPSAPAFRFRLLPRPRPPRPTAIRDPHCSVPGLNHDHPCSVFPAGPQPRPSTPSVPCRTSTTTIPAHCFLPDLNHDHSRPVFPAGRQPRPSPPSVPCRTSTASIHAQCSLPDLNREYPRQKICHIECQKICQIEC